LDTRVDADRPQVEVRRMNSVMSTIRGLPALRFTGCPPSPWECGRQVEDLARLSTERDGVSLRRDPCRRADNLAVGLRNTQGREPGRVPNIG
jgi:hypothetical protein